MSDIIQYVGARYVPLFANPIEWNKSATYEPLTIVTYMNASYTSRKQVPAGIEPTNDEYWALTGNYNAQVEDYRQAVEQYQEEVENLEYLKEFNGKKMLVIGDSNSITGESWLTNPRWVDAAKTLCPNLTIENNSISGRLLSAKEVSNKVQSAIEYVESLPTTISYDYIVIFCGINDYLGSVSLGNATSSTNNNEFNGALNNIITALNSKCPTAQIIYLSPLATYRHTTAIHPLDCYRISAFNICRKFSLTSKQVTYINGNSAPGYIINGTSETAYSQDGLHYSGSYGEIFAKYILRKIAIGGDTNVNASQHIVKIPVNETNADSSNSYSYFQINPDGTLEIKILLTAKVFVIYFPLIENYSEELLTTEILQNIIIANGETNSRCSIDTPFSVYYNTQNTNSLIFGSGVVRSACLTCSDFTNY